ncbi:hypothetical protein EDC01DRAFT_650649 [Geopyxis carbonaria]|nr:hypothetical protein EDC01DRAFT_650649 [Geopyxis carbonaria]
MPPMVNVQKLFSCFPCYTARQSKPLTSQIHPYIHIATVESYASQRIILISFHTNRPDTSPSRFFINHQLPALVLSNLLLLLLLLHLFLFLFILLFLLCHGHRTDRQPSHRHNCCRLFPFLLLRLSPDPRPHITRRPDAQLFLQRCPRVLIESVTIKRLRRFRAAPSASAPTTSTSASSTTTAAATAMSLALPSLRPLAMLVWVRRQRVVLRLRR